MSWKSLVDLLETRAHSQMSFDAFSFLVDGEATVASYTYADLDRRARSIAAAMQDLGTVSGRALLLYPPGLEFIAAFFGCLYAGVTAVPAYPPRNNRLSERIQAIVADARPALILTTSALAAQTTQHDTTIPGFDKLTWLSTDQLPGELEDLWQPPIVNRESLAFLQYTSGSTAYPRGVILTHGHLLHNLALIQDTFRHNSESRGLIWLPPYHDMGLIGGILQPLYVGFPVTLMSPIAFLQRPRRWLQAISQTRATTSGGPNFAYDLCVRKIGPDQLDCLDLSSWQVAFNGAEPIRHQTLETFTARFAPCGFRKTAWLPCYGLAEATLIVSAADPGHPPLTQALDATALEQNRAVVPGDDAAGTRVLVGSGRVRPSYEAAIVNPETHKRCSDRQIGEIWLAGPSIASGYWNQPELTQSTFRNTIDGRGPFLRTGDLGFLDNGELFVTGRLKDLISIRGRNRYPQDIELTVEQAHPLLRLGCGAAFSVDRGDGEQLVVVQEVERRYRPAQAGEVLNAIRAALAEQHGLHARAIILIKAGSLPKTSSGKVQRQACRHAFLANQLDVVEHHELPFAPESNTGAQELPLSRDVLLQLAAEERRPLLQTYLRERLAALLHTAPAQLAPEQPLSGLGLDSLMAIQLQHQLELELGAQLPLTLLLQDTSIAALAKTIEQHITEQTDRWPAQQRPLPPDQAELAPVGPGQRGLWFLQRMDPNSTQYNITRAARISGSLDAGALRHVFQALVDRHPALRTTFRLQHGEVVAMVHDRYALQFDTYDVAHWDTDQLQAFLRGEAQRPFDLEQGPLLRVALLRQRDDHHILLVSVHHIIVDLWSLVVMMDELDQLYVATCEHRSIALPPLPIHFVDAAQQQAQKLDGPEGATLRRYWEQQLVQAPLSIDLPTDRPRPARQTTVGSAYTMTIGSELADRLKALSRAEGTTLYMTLLAAFHVLLYRYSGQAELIVGSPVAGRERAQLANLIGYFVNTVVLRADLTNNPPFSLFLRQVRETVLAALAHQSYPFSLLVEQLQPTRDPSRSPVFQVMFALQKAHLPGLDAFTTFALNVEGARMRLGTLMLESLALDQQAVQFDLALMMMDRSGELMARFEYNTDLFEQSTIERMAEHYRLLLGAIVSQPNLQASAIPLMSDTERNWLLYDLNNTVADYPLGQCFHDLFAAQAARTPDATALVFQEEASTHDSDQGADDTTHIQYRLTYRELNERANQLAHYLQSLGVGPEICVGLCVDRSVWSIIAMLGIFKAGGVYVPLDPNYPVERLAFMIADSQLQLLLTQEHLRATLPAHGSTIVSLDGDWYRNARLSSDNPPCMVSLDHLAYIIYTSGSTGQPKGVLMPHRGLSNLAAMLLRMFDVTPADRVLQMASFGFDASLWDLLLAFPAGATLYVAGDRARRPGGGLLKLLSEQAITIATLTPSLLAVLPADELTALRILVATGESCPAEIVNRWARGRHFFNGYGPTEVTIGASIGACIPGTSRPGIGRPFDNTQIYLLDNYLQPVPPGIPGEIYIGGVGLARGYLDRPDLTAERFVPDPFIGERLEIRDWRLSGAQSPISNLQSPISARLYKTGDRARSLPDGSLDYLGRVDQQVKVRGFRIELGEIEALLRRHPLVRDAVVITHEVATRSTRLVAYVVPTTPSTPLRAGDQRPPTTDDHNGQSSQFSILNSQFSIQELRAFLAEQLPDYMVPSIIIPLDALPLNHNGKVDHRALPSIEGMRPQLQVPLQKPATAIERTIAQVWQEVLQVDEVGVNDNFFDLGGHSLLMVQIHERLSRLLGREVPLVDLLLYPTIHALVRHLTNSNQTPTQDQSQARAAARRQAIARASRGARSVDADRSQRKR